MVPKTITKDVPQIVWDLLMDGFVEEDQQVDLMAVSLSVEILKLSLQKFVMMELMMMLDVL